MKLTRRDLLIAGAAAGLAMTGCKDFRNATGHRIPTQVEPPRQLRSKGHRIADRLGFGATPGLAEEIESDSERYIRSQLAGDIEEPLHLQVRLQRLDIHQFHAMELRDWPEDAILRQLQQAAILRAVYSPNQLRERLVDFWSNHFNIYGRKGWAAYRKADDERRVIRAHALGSFPAMLRASAKSAAMIAYLDNQLNHKAAPNENYARELMELHALGVDAGYSQRDVQEVARCLTGWGIERSFLSGAFKGRPSTFGMLRFDPDLHDDGEKIVLGKRIPAGGGPQDLDRVLDILVGHPASAKFISTKLCRYFLGEDLGRVQPVVEKAFSTTGGDIKAAVSAIVESRQILDGPPLIKRPFDYIVSAIRAFGFDTDGGANVQQHLEAMGQPLYQWPMPDGYPDQTEAWKGSLLARWNFALALAHGQVKGCQMPQAAVLNLGRRAGALVGSDAPSQTVQESIALALCSPEFQWR